MKTLKLCLFCLLATLTFAAHSSFSFARIRLMGTEFPVCCREYIGNNHYYHSWVCPTEEGETPEEACDSIGAEKAATEDQCDLSDKPDDCDDY